MSKQTVRSVAMYILAAVLAVFLVFSTLVGSYFSARAEEMSGYDATNVLDDLRTMEIDGKPFSLSDYAPDGNTQTDVIMLSEFCYGYYSNMRGAYGLYVYVWNPRLISYNLTSESNQIELGTIDGGEHQKYRLQYLNMSTEAGYEGVFYKFKVVLSSAQKQEIYNTFSGLSERYYHVAGIELLQSGELNAIDYNVNKEYIYSGYAAGYGPDSTAESTLSLMQDVGRTLGLDVHLAAYRPDGNNGVTENTQDSIHTAYFAVPNYLIEAYGEMTAVHATWLNAVLAPSLVIKQDMLDSLQASNMSLQQQLDKYLGVNIGRYVSDSEYAFAFGSCVFNSAVPAVRESGYTFYYNLDNTSGASFQLYGELFDIGMYTGRDISWLISRSESYKEAGEGKTAMTDSLYLNALNMYIAVNTNDLANYEVPIGTTKNRMIELTDTVYSSKPKVLDKYAENLFSNMDEEFTDITISSDDTYKLTEKTLADYWARIGGKTYNTQYRTLDAIYAIQSNDLVGEKEAICERLCIGENYYDEFAEFYDDNKEDSTIYLMRYQLSDYEALEAHIYDRNSQDRTKWFEVDGFNAYIFQEVVNLEFDIIDVTFTQGASETVMAVISNPQDFIPEPTPPLIHGGENGMSWFTIAMVLIVSVAGLAITIIVKRAYKKHSTKS